MIAEKIVFIVECSQGRRLSRIDRPRNQRKAVLKQLILDFRCD